MRPFFCYTLSNFQKKAPWHCPYRRTRLMKIVSFGHILLIFSFIKSVLTQPVDAHHNINYYHFNLFPWDASTLTGECSRMCGLLQGISSTVAALKFRPRISSGYSHLPKSTYPDAASYLFSNHGWEVCHRANSFFR